jgi:hypothetical protein
MVLGDAHLNYYVKNVLKLPTEKREEYLGQVDYLIKQLRGKIDDGSVFGVGKFVRCGSLMKGTALKPREGTAVDADVAVELDASEAEAKEIGLLHAILLDLLIKVYPQKVEEDFSIQPRTLGIVFRASGLNLDLVPIVPVPGKPGYGWQHSSRGDVPVMTSVTGQLAFVSNRAKADPRFKRLVRMLKRWRNYQELDSLGSFTIELLVAHRQDTDGPAPTLEEGLQRFFMFVAQSGLKELVTFPEVGKPRSMPEDSVVIIDPVNVENNVTKRLEEDERRAVITSAKVAWETLMTASYAGPKGETVDYWKELFGPSFRIED